MTEWLTAFVDETGTNDLETDKNGVSNLFICVAVVVNNGDIESNEIRIREIGAELCSGAEISSKRIGSDHERRIKFLEKAALLPFGYVALVINKDKIPKDSGLQYKRSFYKFINRMLYERLRKNGQNLRVYADEIGGRDFMDSYIPYLKKQNLPELFEKFDHHFANSASTPLIQLADLIAGTLSYCFDTHKAGDHSTVFREILRTRELATECWPWDSMAAPRKIPTESPKDDILRRKLASRVVDFLNLHAESSDIFRQMQVITLKHLLFARQFEDYEKQALVSDRLIERLRNEGFEELSKQAFQAKIIGHLRDDGIVLSGASDGYRLALSEKDILDYLSHDKNIIEPMIARILKARESVLNDTAHKYDILNIEGYSGLKNLAAAFNDAKVTDSSTRSDHRAPTTD